MTDPVLDPALRYSADIECFSVSLISVSLPVKNIEASFDIRHTDRRSARLGRTDTIAKHPQDLLVCSQENIGSHTNRWDAQADLRYAGCIRSVPRSAAHTHRRSGSRTPCDQPADHKIFIKKYKPGSKPSEKREKQRVLNSHLLPFFGEITIEGLKQTDVDTYAQKELDRRMAIKTVNNQLAVLSTLIKYTMGEKSRLRFKLDGMAGELHAVAMADVEKLLGACDDVRFTAAILLTAEAGLRAAEIRGLQWTDIKAGQITIRRTLDKLTNEPVAPKHNKSRTVPMSGRLSASLASLPRRGLWVVAEADGSPVTYDRMIDVVHAVYDRAGVARPPNALHCLRHTFGTVMARKVPLPVLQKLMGHADVQTTLRYIDVNEDEKREAIALVFGAPTASVQATRKQESVNQTMAT